MDVSCLAEMSPLSVQVLHADGQIIRSVDHHDETSAMGVFNGSPVPPTEAQADVGSSSGSRAAEFVVEHSLAAIPADLKIRPDEPAAAEVSGAAVVDVRLDGDDVALGQREVLDAEAEALAAGAVDVGDEADSRPFGCGFPNSADGFAAKLFLIEKAGGKEPPCKKRMDAAVPGLFPEELAGFRKSGVKVVGSFLLQAEKASHEVGGDAKGNSSVINDEDVQSLDLLRANADAFPTGARADERE